MAWFLPPTEYVVLSEALIDGGESTSISGLLQVEDESEASSEARSTNIKSQTTNITTIKQINQSIVGKLHNLPTRTSCPNVG